MLQYSNIYLTLNVATCRVSWELHKIILLKIMWISDILYQYLIWYLFQKCSDFPHLWWLNTIFWMYQYPTKMWAKSWCDMKNIFNYESFNGENPYWHFWEEKTLSYGKFTMLIRKKKVLLAVFMWQELSPVLLRCPSYVTLLLMGSGLY